MGFRRGARSGFVIGAAGIAVVAVVCLASFAISPGGRFVAQRSSAKLPACETNLQLPTPICHVFVVFLENQEASKVYNASFEHYLATQYAYAARYYSVEHYSFPNYVAATAGYADNWIHPMAWQNLVTLFNQRTPHLSWFGFMQNMLYPCWRNGTAEYRVDHNPFVWYNNLYSNLTNCKFHDQSFNAWNADLTSGQIPNYALFAPNTTNDCWRWGLWGCDHWLRGWLSPLVNASFFANSVYFITYDEGWTNDTASSNGTVGGGHVYTAAVSPFACRGSVSYHPYNPYDLFTTTEWLLDLPQLGPPNQDNWSADPPMKDLFCFPSGSTGGTLPYSAGAIPSAVGGILGRATSARSPDRPARLRGQEVGRRPTQVQRETRGGFRRPVSCPRSRDPS
jgi:hypothetical protein